MKTSNHYLAMSLNVIDRIAGYADIDTRRAMGYPPRKLNFDPEFKFRGFEGELFVYYEDQRLLKYFEVGKFGYLYYEYVTEILPLNRGEIPCHWQVLEGSRTRGLVLHTDNQYKEYDMMTPQMDFFTAGCPIFCTK